MNNPILTCETADQPGDTQRRVRLFAKDGETVLGWGIHRPTWPGDMFSAIACWEGRAYIVGYVRDINSILNAVATWHQKMGTDDLAEEGNP